MINDSPTRQMLDSISKIKIDTKLMKEITDAYNDHDNNNKYGYLQYPNDIYISGYPAKGIDLCCYIILQWNNAYNMLCKMAKHYDESLVKSKKSGDHSHQFQDYCDNNDATYYYHTVMKEYKSLFYTFTTKLDTRFCMSSDQSVSSLDNSSSRRNSPSIVARNQLSLSLDCITDAAVKQREFTIKESKSRLEATARLEKRKLVAELSKREEVVMDHSIFVEAKILDVTRLMDRPNLDPQVMKNYTDIVGRLTKKQKVLDDRIENIRSQIRSCEESD